MNTPRNLSEDERKNQRIEFIHAAHQRTQYAFLQAFQPYEEKKSKHVPQRKLSLTNKQPETLKKLILQRLWAVDISYSEAGRRDLNCQRPLISHLNFILMILSVFFIVALLGVLNPILIGHLVTKGIYGHNAAEITRAGFMLLGIGVGIGFFSIIKIILFTRMETLLIYHFQSYLMKHLLKLPLSFFDQYSIGDLCHRVLMIESLSKIVGPNQMGLFLSFTFSFINVIVMAYYSWQLTLCIIVVIGIFSVASLWSNRQQMPHIEQYIKNLGDTYGFALQVVHGISRIKLFSKEAYVEAIWAEKYMQARRSLFSAFRIGVWRYTLSNHIQPLSILIIFVMTGQLQRNQLPLESFIIFFSAFTQFIIGFTICSLQAQGFAPVITAYNRLKPILDEEVETQQDHKPHTLMGNILFQNIQFNYPSSHQCIFNSLNCSVAPGEHVAFVGLSGSGKSTLLKLLLGFYTPQSGQIYYDSKSMNDLDILTIRQQIGVVFQDGKLMTASILENIIGHANATEEDAWRVLKLVGLEHFITALPMGLNTIISQHMNVLSGGQKQLLLLAKALVGNPSILLLDEATNALDNNAQNLVINRINQLKMTRISIAHRLSTVLYADKIMVLSQGSIVETGSYSELIKKRGHFYTLVEHQQGTHEYKETAS